MTQRKWGKVSSPRLTPEKKLGSRRAIAQAVAHARRKKQQALRRDRIGLLVGTEYLHDAFTVTRASTATYRDASGTLMTASANQPRYDYDASGNYLGLLIEESRTNLLTWSEDFSQWSASGSTSVISDAATAPDDTTSADRIEKTGETDDYRFKSVSIPATTVTYTGSIHIEKTVGVTHFAGFYLLFSGGSGGSNIVVVNTNTGEVTSGTGETEDAGDYWRLKWSSANTDNTSIMMRVYPAWNTTGSGVRDNTALGSNVFWGAQLESGSFATSYIPTTSAAVTRAADDIVCTDLAAIGFSQTAGTIYGQATSAPVATGTDTLLIFNDATLNERINIRRNVGNFQLLVVDGTTQALISTAWASSAERKFAAAWAAGDFAGYFAGAQAGTDAAGTLPTVTQAQIGRELGGSYFNGHIHTLRYKPVRAPDAELQSWTAL